MKKLSELINESSNKDVMTVKDLIKYLETFNKNLKVMIDESTDGGFSSNRPLIKSDIQKLDDDKIIFISMY